MRLLLFVLALGLAVPGRAEPALLSPATEISDPAANPAWRDLLARLAPRQGRESRFEERRYFPFRRKPIVLTGEIRLTPERGLSLQYLTPRTRVLIADDRGLLMRDSAGNDVPAPANGGSQLAVAALVDLLRFDLPALQRKFTLHGQRTGEDWTLAFVPRDRALADNLEAIIVRGTGGTLAEIELRNSPEQRIDIFVRDTRQPVSFTREQVARYFR